MRDVVSRLLFAVPETCMVATDIEDRGTGVQCSES